MMHLLLLASLLGPPDGAGRAYDADSRIGYLARSIAAIRSAPPAALSQALIYLSAMERNSCKSPIERLRVDCLMTAARRHCRARTDRTDAQLCPLYTDVIVSDALAEKAFISTTERYAIMRTHEDYRDEMKRQLRRIQGALAADLRLSMENACTADDYECLAYNIDGYCLGAADIRSLSYQACAASLVWFIGTAVPGS